MTNRNKLYSLIAAMIVFVAAGFLSACENEETPESTGTGSGAGAGAIVVTGINLSGCPWGALTIGGPNVNSSIKLTHTVVPANATNIGDVEWTSANPAVATVSADGVVTAVGIGTTRITVRQNVTNAMTGSPNFFSIVCDITVVETVVPVTGVTIGPEEINLQHVVNPNGKVTFSVQPPSATNQNYMLTSNNPAAVSVDDEGNIFAVFEGRAIITITSSEGRFTEQMVVNVSKLPVESISLNETAIDLEPGDEPFQLIATIVPDNASIRDVIWTSSEPNRVSVVPSVDEDGVPIPLTATLTATGLALGEATITVTTVCGNFTATCKVFMPNVFGVTDVIIAREGTTTPAGNFVLERTQEEKLEAIIAPANATIKDVIWTSSEPSVVSVDSDGNIEALSVGSAVIRVTTVDGGGDIYDEVEITVVSTPVNGVSLNVCEMVLPLQTVAGEATRNVAREPAFYLEATIEPANATNQILRWRIENSEPDDGGGDDDEEETAVITLERTSGSRVRIIGKNPGKVTVRVFAAEGSTEPHDGPFSATCDIIVGEDLWLDRTDWTIPGLDNNSNLGTIGYSSHQRNPADGGGASAILTDVLSGNTSGFWHAAWNNPNTNYPHWIVVDLGKEEEFDGIILQRRQGNGGSSTGYRVDITNDIHPDDPNATSWTTVDEFSFDPGINNIQPHLLAAPIKARYVRLYFDAKFRGTGSHAMKCQFGLYRRE